MMWRPVQVNKGKVVLLSGGNLQIAKGDGDPPVQASLAAMPGGKSGLGKRLDELIVRTIPNVKKSIEWNSLFYGVEGQGWFLSFHVFTRYVKVTFFKGMSLRPIPPGGTRRSGEARRLDIYEDDPFNETQLADWIRQAVAIPGGIPWTGYPDRLKVVEVSGCVPQISTSTTDDHQDHLLSLRRRSAILPTY